MSCASQAGCDYVVNTMPSTAQTRGLLGREGDPVPPLEACDGAVLINVGRGDVVVLPTSLV